MFKRAVADIVVSIFDWILAPLVFIWSLLMKLVRLKNFSHYVDASRG